MKLTIEKAKEIVSHPENYCDIGPLGHSQTWEAKGFIEGWNQAIDEIVSRFDKKSIIYSTEALLLKEIKELKVESEK